MGHKGKKETAANLLEWRERPFNPRAARDTADLFEMCVKALQRVSTREKALTMLSGELERFPLLHNLNETCFNLFALCGVCIKEGSDREARLAYRAVGLLALTLRAGPAALMDESFPLLSRTLKDQDNDAPATPAAIDCLAAVTFAGAQTTEDVERAMKVIWGVISRSSKLKTNAKAKAKASAQVLASAVSTWAFLLTTIVSVSDVVQKGDGVLWNANATVAALAGLLDHEDRAVRVAAGQALAVCDELNLTRRTPQKDDMDALATILPEQRDLFRPITDFLDHDERLMESLPTSLDGRVALQVSTWAKRVQLHFLTRFHGKGFLRHVENNQLFKEAFSYGADEGKVLSVAKKKHSSGETKMKDYIYMRIRHWDCTWDPTIFRPEMLLKIRWH